jgi:hypothetical protein
MFGPNLFDFNSPKRYLQIHSDIHLDAINAYLLCDIRISPRVRQRLIHRQLVQNRNMQRADNWIPHVASMQRKNPDLAIAQGRMYARCLGGLKRGALRDRERTWHVGRYGGRFVVHRA